MRRLLTIGLCVWGVAGLAIGGLLLAQHVAALPTPATSDDGLRAALSTAFPHRDARWRVVHVMYRSCPCSRRTIDHLLSTPRPPELDEIVLVVDDDGTPGSQDRMLRAAGFTVEVIKPAVLASRFRIESAPLLVIVNPDRELAYVGGYNRRKQSAAYEDLAILDDLRKHHERSALPVFGCPTSAKLAAAIDPLGLRQW